jgi:hypothetical protein
MSWRRNLAALAFVLCLPMAAQAQPAFGQVKVAGPTAATATMNVTFDSSVSVGTLIYVCSSSQSIVTTLNAPTDGASNTYTEVEAASQAGAVQIKCWKAVNGSAGAHTITSTAGTTATMQLMAITFTSTSDTEDGSNNGTGSSVTTIDAGSIVTTQTSVALVSVVVTSSNETFTAPTDYTVPTGGSTTRGAVAYQIVASTDTYAAQWAIGDGSGSGAATHVALVASSASTPGCRGGFFLRGIGC